MFFLAPLYPTHVFEPYSPLILVIAKFSYVIADYIRRCTRSNMFLLAPLYPTPFAWALFAPESCHSSVSPILWGVIAGCLIRCTRSIMFLPKPLYPTPLLEFYSPLIIVTGPFFLCKSRLQSKVHTVWNVPSCAPISETLCLSFIRPWFRVSYSLGVIACIRRCTRSNMPTSLN